MFQFNFFPPTKRYKGTNMITLKKPKVKRKNEKVRFFFKKKYVNPHIINLLSRAQRRVATVIHILSKQDKVIEKTHIFIANLAGVSISTVRRTLDIMENEGLLARITIQLFYTKRVCKYLLSKVFEFSYVKEVCFHFFKEVAKYSLSLLGSKSKNNYLSEYELYIKEKKYIINKEYNSGKEIDIVEYNSSINCNLLSSSKKDTERDDKIDRILTLAKDSLSQDAYEILEKRLRSGFSLRDIAQETGQRGVEYNSTYKIEVSSPAKEKESNGFKHIGSFKSYSR